MLRRLPKEPRRPGSRISIQTWIREQSLWLVSRREAFWSTNQSRKKGGEGVISWGLIDGSNKLMNLLESSLGLHQEPSVVLKWASSILYKVLTDFWNFLISLRATVPGLYLCGFLTPPVTEADFLAALVASCFLGCLIPVVFLAVCFVLAIEHYNQSLDQNPDRAECWYNLGNAYCMKKEYDQAIEKFRKSIEMDN